jgi:hypothetical protein
MADRREDKQRSKEMSRRANRFKVMGGLLVVAMALFAVFAGQASAFTWTTAASMTPGTTMPIGVEASGNSVLKGTVTGQEVELTSTTVEAVEGKIAQTGKESAGVATATGKLKYTGLSLQKPVGCGAPTSITTTNLTAETAKATGLTTAAALKFKPASGTVFATITLTGECALAGTPFKVTVPEGSFFCGETEKFGTMAVKQPIRTSGTINSNCGGKLEAGGNAATLTGTAKGFSTETVGAEWGASETGSL